MLFWLAPFSHKRQMVAETVHITWSEIIAAWLHTAIFLVGNKKERGVIDTACQHAFGKRGAYKDMVEAAPLSLITIRSLCSVMSFGICRDVREATITNHKQTLRLGIVIKVARYDDVGIRRSRLYGVSKGTDCLCCSHSEGP